MPRLKSVAIENFRSIGETPVTIKFPDNKPIIIIGENNSGKSNITRAIELVFGEFHPKYKKLDDYDHFMRNPHNKIVIKSEVTGFHNRLGYDQQYSCGGFNFTCVKDHENEFVAIQFENGEENKFVSTKLRDELLCVVVNSEQNLNYQLSYSSKYTLLYKVTKAFHDKLIEDDQRVIKLKGLFDQIKDTFQEVQEFKNFGEKMSYVAGEMLSNMAHALEFDFSAYDPSNYFKTLRVYPTEDGHTRAFEELGAGQQQILALTFAHAYAKSFLGQGLIFIIDEPETHLHPLAQKWLAKQMFKMANDGLQLVLTTHSPYFVNLEHLASIYLVRKEEQTIVINVTPQLLTQKCQATGVPQASEDTIVPFYAAHGFAHILNGFFANKIVLVEGPSEELALPTYFEAVGLDTLKNGIAIIGVGGKGNLAKWWRFFTVYGIPTFICFDNDLGDDANGNKRKDALRAIGITEAEMATLLTTEDWNISGKFCVFGNDFETTLRNSFVEYETFEQDERQRLGDSKPIIARMVAQKLQGLQHRTQPGWAKFELLKQKLIALT